MKKLIILATIGVAPLAACGSKMDANEKNFTEAIARTFINDDEVCTDARKWPADIRESEAKTPPQAFNSDARQLATLERLGLVKSSATRADMDGMVVPVVRYTLTEKAVPFYREQSLKTVTINGPIFTKGGTLCFAKAALDKVVRWDQPMKLGEYEEVKVKYTYKVTDVADWARQPEFAAVFPVQMKMIEGSGKAEVTETLKKTNQGWEAISAKR